MDAISQTTFSNAFSWMKMFEFRLKFHWSLFPRVQLIIFQQWFRQWLGAVQVTSHCLIQRWLAYRRIYASLSLNELIHSFHSCCEVISIKFHSYQPSTIKCLHIHTAWHAGHNAWWIHRSHIPMDQMHSFCCQGCNWYISTAAANKYVTKTKFILFYLILRQL